MSFNHQTYASRRTSSVKPLHMQWPLPSSLDWITEQRTMKAGVTKGLIHRLVYIARLSGNGKTAAQIGEYYEQLVKNVQTQRQMESVTGLLLIFPKHFIHIVESSMETLLDIVRDVVELEEDENSFINRAKILAVGHDIQAKISAQWSFRSLDIQVANIDTYEASDTVDRLVIDMLTQTIKLGSYLARQPKSTGAIGEEVSMKSAMDTLHEKVPELLPQQAVIEYLIADEESTCIIMPRDFLRQYMTTFDVHLHTEYTWPLPVQLFPYTY